MTACVATHDELDGLLSSVRDANTRGLLAVAYHAGWRVGITGTGKSVKLVTMTSDAEIIIPADTSVNDNAFQGWAKKIKRHGFEIKSTEMDLIMATKHGKGMSRHHQTMIRNLFGRRGLKVVGEPRTTEVIPQPEDLRYIGTTEAAEILGISGNGVVNRISKGAFPRARKSHAGHVSLATGFRWEIPYEDVLAAPKSHRKRPEPFARKPKSRRESAPKYHAGAPVAPPGRKADKPERLIPLDKIPKPVIPDTVYAPPPTSSEFAALVDEAKKIMDRLTALFQRANELAVENEQAAKSFQALRELVNEA